MAPSSTNDILISVHSRYRSSPHPLLQHALVAQLSAADDAGAGAGAEASVDGDGVHGCDRRIRAAASSPQMALSTATGPCTITVRCDDASHTGEREGNNTTTVELVGADCRHSAGASGAVAVVVPLSETAATAVDERDDEHDHHDQDPPDPVDAPFADELEDDDDDDGTRAMEGGGNLNFLTEVYDFLLQDMEPEENEQLHLQIATTGGLNAELLAAFAERITQGIAAGRLRNPLVVPAAATTSTTMGSDDDQAAAAYRGGGFGGVPAAAAAIAGLEKRRYDDAASRDDGDGEGCVICFVDYKHGDELAVMPCAHGHAFHRECIAEWLARSHLCPLCRHALPTEDEEASSSTRAEDGNNLV